MHHITINGIPQWIWDSRENVAIVCFVINDSIGHLCSPARLRCGHLTLLWWELNGKAKVFINRFLILQLMWVSREVIYQYFSFHFTSPKRLWSGLLIDWLAIPNETHNYETAKRSAYSTKWRSLTAYPWLPLKPPLNWRSPFHMMPNTSYRVNLSRVINGPKRAIPPQIN